MAHLSEEDRRHSGHVRRQYEAAGWGPATPPRERAAPIRRMRAEGATWSDAAALFGISTRQAMTLAQEKTQMLVTATERKIIEALRSGKGKVEFRNSTQGDDHGE